MRIFLLAVVTLSGVAAGCGSGPTSGAPDTGVDAASMARDAGVITGDGGGGYDAATTSDAGAASDGGSIADVGADATPADAGSAIDAPTSRTDAGLPCTASSDCADPSMSFCAFPVGTCGGMGTCTRYGGACPLFFRPVCGCNGHTYSNAICAEQAGQSIADPNAACEITPTCGCMRDGDCPGNDECVATASGGVCKTRVTPPMCWRDDDCGAGGSCVGAQVCQCGARCLVADHAGTCAVTM